MRYLDAAEAVLRSCGRPLSSKELVADACALRLIAVNGNTPHKTMNARLSEDIRGNPQTRFMRTYHGQFALREWSGELLEFETKRRRIRPMDEDILVIPRTAFNTLALSTNSAFHDLDPVELLRQSVSRKRQLIEEDNNYVQIISLFHIVWKGRYLTYNRTSRLPEARLHHIRSINFGGHLQNVDRAPLFETYLPDEIGVVYMRELYEELIFSAGFEEVTYIGSIHSQVDAFSARHIGVCYRVIPKEPDIRSNEPGFHTSVQFADPNEIVKSPKEFDEWTFLVMERTKVR